VVDVATGQHLGHAALDLVGLALALSTFGLAVAVATVMDRRATREPSSPSTSHERNDR
jgi:hypothetical protein